MSKEKKVVSLTSTARSAIASAITQAISANDSSGSLVTQACNVAHKYAKGEAISDEDRSKITDDIAAARGWKGDAIKVRKSECNTFLKTYDKLPEAEKMFRKRSGGVCQWTNMLSIARKLVKGEKLGDAVEQAFKGGSGGAGNPNGRLAGALVSMFDASRGDKRAAVVSAVRLLTAAKVIQFKAGGKAAAKFANA